METTSFTCIECYSIITAPSVYFLNIEGIYCYDSQLFSLNNLVL